MHPIKWAEPREFVKKASVSRADDHERVRSVAGYVDILDRILDHGIRFDAADAVNLREYSIDPSFTISAVLDLQLVQLLTE